MRPVITDAELKEALEVAGKATPGPWSYAYEGSGDFHVHNEWSANQEDRCIAHLWRSMAKEQKLKDEDAAHIATMNPEFASRLIKELQWYRSGEIHTCHDKCERELCKLRRELIWAREMMGKAKANMKQIERFGAAPCGEEPGHVESCCYSTWLSNYEKGPG